MVAETKKEKNPHDHHKTGEWKQTYQSCAIGSALICSLPNLPINAVSISCAIGSIACPAIAGKESFINSRLISWECDWLAGVPVYLLQEILKSKYVIEKYKNQ